MESPYGTGQFIHDLESAFPEQENLILANIENKAAVYTSIKQFLGKGR